MSLGPLFTFDKMGEKGAAAKAKEQIFRQVFGSKTGLQAMRMSALSLLKVVSCTPNKGRLVPPDVLPLGIAFRPEYRPARMDIGRSTESLSQAVGRETKSELLSVSYRRTTILHGLPTNDPRPVSGMVARYI